MVRIHEEETMTLHEAIAEVLKRSPGHFAHIEDITRAIRKKRLYRRGDGEYPPREQVSARVGRYPHLFRRLGGGVVGLR
jgi:hypothetical protein